LKRGAGGKAALFGGAQEVSLAVLPAFGLEGLDGTVLEAEGGIGDGASGIEGDGAAEAPAGFAGPQGMIEGEAAGLGFWEVELAVGAMPTGGEGV
jgi:hypothetical protein